MFLNRFKTGIFIILLFVVGVYGPKVPGINGIKKAKDQIVKLVIKGTNYQRIINLFAEGQYRQDNCPRELDVTFGPGTAKELFDELLKVFVFAPAETDLTIPVDLKRYTVNVNNTQNEIVRKVAENVIKETFKNEDKLRESTELFGENALRVGADLYRAFYCVIAADYKRVRDMANPDFQTEFAAKVGVIEHHLDDFEKGKRVEKAKRQVLGEKIEHFRTIWKQVDSLDETISLEKKRVIVLAAEKAGTNKEPKVDKKQGDKDRKAQLASSNTSRMKV